MKHYSEFLEDFNPDALSVKHLFWQNESYARQIANFQSCKRENLKCLDEGIAKHYTKQEITEAKRQFKLSK